MEAPLLEPDQPPQEGELETYIYRELQRYADALNQANERIAELEAQVASLLP